MADAWAVTPLGQVATADGNASPSSDQGVCSCKAITKFCLLYYTTLNLVVLIFTAFNQENLTKQQLTWYWGFLLTLFLTSSMAITSLMLLLYTDYYAVVSEVEGIYLKDDYKEAKTKETASKNDENSASFKTVLTINSSLPDKLDPILPTLVSPPPPDLSAFINMTPSVKSPVTLVDMKKGRLDKKLQLKQSTKTTDRFASGKDEVDAVAQQVKLATETNLAAIPSDVLAKDSKEKTFLNKLKNKNKKPRVKKKPST